MNTYNIFNETDENLDEYTDTLNGVLDYALKYEKDLKYIEENSKIIVVMFYKVIEDITEYGEIVSDNKEIR